MNNELTIETLFPTCVSYIHKPEFLSSALSVFNEYIKLSESQQHANPLYPVVMTGNMAAEGRIKDLCDYVLNTAWNVLQFQGYNMDLYYTQFAELFGQEHKTGSSMDYHIHGFGSQISGFYFIEVPENTSTLMFHDPRPSKVYADLPETDYSLLTYATKIVNYKPKAGEMYFHNSWLPHSFTKNGNKNPLKFLHFNINVILKQIFDQQPIELKPPIIV